MDSEPGTVWWITGLAGAGKSTLGRRLWERLVDEGRSAVLLDGDTLRSTLFPDIGHEHHERLDLALRFGSLCAVLADQGHDVVIATISLFPEVWEANRARFGPYCEIYVHAPPDVLERRKPHLYAPDLDRGPVMGVDIPAAEPPDAHLRLLNDGRRRLEDLVDAVLKTRG